MLLFVLLSFWAYSQNPDFSGSWSLDASKSKLNPDFSMAPEMIIIELQGNNMKVERRSNFQGQESTTTDQFTLDGKECKNTGFMDSQKISTATWSDDKKSIKVLSKIAFDGGEVNLTEIFRMDGTSLILDSSSASSFGDMSELYVYNKK